MKFDISKIQYDGKDIRKKAKFYNKVNSRLAEIIGIVLGDGGLYQYHKNKYTVAVVFNKKEVDYLNYVRNLLNSYFAPYIFSFFEDKHEYKLHNNSIFVGSILSQAGIKVGNKIKNNVEIPGWIFHKKYLKYAIRGLFDSDGCVYRKYDDYAQIQFKFASYSLIKSVRTALIFLNFHPTKIQKQINNKEKFDWKFYLSRQKEIESFFEEIKPSNIKHVERFNKIRNGDVGI